MKADLMALMILRKKQELDIWCTTLLEVAKLPSWISCFYGIPKGSSSHA